MLFDSQARCLTSNRPGLELMKTSSNEISGILFRDMWPEEFHPIVDFAVQQVFSGQSSSFEARRMNGGQMADWKVIVTPVDNGNIGVKNFIAIGQDVTTQKRNELEKEKIFHDLKKAYAEIKMLKGIIPICSHCKKIRDRDGSWNQLEVYLDKHSEAQLSHGICPDCMVGLKEQPK
jgi:PAS domain S-box-containing protein